MNSTDRLTEQPRMAIRELARREGVHISTVWRWVLRGVRGHRLEVLRIGYRAYVTEPSWRRFAARINGEQMIDSQDIRLRDKEMECAAKELDKLGI